MSGIFDTHTHFNDNIYKELDILTEDMIKEANINGVKWFCCVGFDVNSSKKAAKYAIKYKNVYGAVGIHPDEAHKVTEEDIKEIDVLSHAENIVAIGEIGLDYYYTSEHKDVQKEVFRKQIKIAKEANLVVMLHIRDKQDSEEAYEDALKILDELKVKKAIVHCYTKGYDLAKKFTERGYLISIPGVVTFKNAKELHETVKRIPLNSMVVETDAPYLTPEPNRGKINTSKEIIHTIDRITKIKNLEKADVIDVTTRNALKIFNIKD
ncbi:TatD family hydrolase [Spiroplasma apis]|uniref:Mg-dependent DNase n=1 Tax=Spiroplasma apis B31 TaxID=1276258 RepID=V5RL33_SPIAP|nr:TatD family hydrolase [Spiroplasma apis]AHB36841.1 Mg-dependent DNase [Spiroplasma apis B31]